MNSKTNTNFYVFVEECFFTSSIMNVWIVLVLYNLIKLISDHIVDLLGTINRIERLAMLRLIVSTIMSCRRCKPVVSQ